MQEPIKVLAKILTNILTALYEPFGFSLLLSFLAKFFYLYAYESMGAGKGWKNAIVTWYQKFKESVFFRKLFFLAFVTSLILFRTLLNRQLWMNPLSDVMGGWGIWETVNGEQKLTTECIENVIMMMPFSAVVMWTFEEKIGNGWKKILWQSGKIAFIFSISIEMLQLFLRLGTFHLFVVSSRQRSVIGRDVITNKCRKTNRCYHYGRYFETCKGLFERTSFRPSAAL